MTDDDGQGEPLRFTAEIIDGGGGGHAVVVPTEVVAALSSKRPRVRALVNGTAYHSRIAIYSRTSFLGLRKDLLRAIGADTGDSVEIELTEEPEPPATPAPEPQDPAELTAALAADREVAAAWAALPAEHRQEYDRWFAAAADEITRADRVARVVRRLQGG